jgi:hypothetical protein
MRDRKNDKDEKMMSGMKTDVGKRGTMVREKEKLSCAKRD